MEQYCTVELNGSYTRGQMVIDHVGLSGNVKNSVIVNKVDMDRFKKLLLWGLGGPSCL